MAQETDLTKDREELQVTTTGGSGDDVAGEETEQIRAEIAETRSDMGETIDAIQERLSVANISEQVSEQVHNAIDTVKDNVYEASIGKAVQFMKETREEVMRTSVGRTIMENPIPFALIGIGAGLLVARSRGGKSGQTGSKRYRTQNGVAAGLSQSASESASSGSRQPGNAALKSVTGAASSVASSATDAASRVYDKAGELASTAQGSYDRYLQQKPMALAAAAVAVGAAVGFAIPSTQYEGKLMGETRETLFSKAGETASGLIDNAKDVAMKAGQSVTEELQAATKEAAA